MDFAGYLFANNNLNKYITGFAFNTYLFPLQYKKTYHNKCKRLHADLWDSQGYAYHMPVHLRGIPNYIYLKNIFNPIQFQRIAIIWSQ